MILFDSDSEFYILLGILLGILFLILSLGLILVISSSHKISSGMQLNSATRVGQGIFAHLIIVFERIFPIPLFFAFFRSFSCGLDKTNIFSETVETPLAGGNCWGLAQIIAASVSGASLLIFLVLQIFSFLFFSSSCYNSKLPWADQHYLTRLLVLADKIVIAAFLVFDPKVFNSLTLNR